MAQDIKTYIQQCLVCQQAKTTTTLPAGLLQPLPIPNQIWEDLAMDFITGLPLSQGFTVICVVIDRLSKAAHFIPMKQDFTSKSVAELFFKHIVKLHGLPKSIVSDRDKVFTSQFWKFLWHFSGTTLKMSSVYHPQSDGQSEVLNKCLELYLRCFTFDAPREWSKMLSWAEYWYNTAYHISTGMTPFRIVYGREPSKILPYVPQADDPLSVQEQLFSRDYLLQKLKSNLQRAQQVQKKYADKKRIDVELQVGDLVLVKLQPYRQHSLALRKNQKLGFRYFGPFKVIDRIRKVAYKLQLPTSAKIHPVFHISQLKLCRGQHDQPYLPLPICDSEIPPLIQPMAILKSRTIIRGEQQVQQSLIQWENGLPKEATWEDNLLIARAYPHFNLGDKVDFDGGSIVMKGIPLQGQTENEQDTVSDNLMRGKHVAVSKDSNRSTRAKRESVWLKNYVT